MSRKWRNWYVINTEYDFTVETKVNKSHIFRSGPKLDNDVNFPQELGKKTFAVFFSLLASFTSVTLTIFSRNSTSKKKSVRD